MLVVVGVNDDVDTCSCCGRSGLKRVVWIDDTEDMGTPTPYGTTCAGKVMGWQGTRNDLQNKAAGAAVKYQEDLAVATMKSLRETGRIIFVEGCWVLPEDADMIRQAKATLAEAKKWDRDTQGYRPTEHVKAELKAEGALARAYRQAKEHLFEMYPDAKGPFSRVY